MRKHNGICISVVLIIIAGVILTGCTNLLEYTSERTTITPHQAPPYERPPTELISVSNYEEFMTTILEHIMIHETEFRLIYYPYEGEDVQAEVLRASNEILTEHPVGVYAVTSIIPDAARIVTHFEIDVIIEYKRTKEQIESIVNAATSRYMTTQLSAIMSEYREEAVFRTRLQFTEEEITDSIRDIYYQNPRRILMMPRVAIEIFPEEGPDRIYEIKFGYIDDQSILLGYGEDLELHVREEARQATGNTDSEIILSLARRLIDSTQFDENIAGSIHVHGAQNYAATAFGALVRGIAVGEGFAMAFKALCDELRFDSRIVLGYYNGMVHAWNIVFLYGEYYHIDIAMCVVNGIETAFLKTDADFEEMYVWDRENTVRCEGSLTLEDIVGPADPDETEDPDETDNPDETQDPDIFNNEQNNEEDND